MAEVPEDIIPYPSKTKLKQVYVGKHLRQVPTPAAVVDRAVVQRNCKQMLEACSALRVEFRPHVKTHKVLHALAGKARLTARLDNDSIGSSFLFYGTGIHRFMFFLWIAFVQDCLLSTSQNQLGHPSYFPIIVINCDDVFQFVNYLLNPWNFFLASARLLTEFLGGTPKHRIH